MSQAETTNSPITVDVWSDVMCPFCWMGDKHLELALGDFAHRDDVEITYHSYQKVSHCHLLRQWRSKKAFRLNSSSR